MIKNILHLRYKIKLWYRVFKLRSLGAAIGKNVKIQDNITVLFPNNLHIGDNSKINEGVFLNASGKIFIDKNVHISPRVMFQTGILVSTNIHRCKSIKVEKNVWIASGSIINGGVIIGAYSKIGSGSIITKDVPYNSFVCGNPAVTKGWGFL